MLNNNKKKLIKVLVSVFFIFSSFVFLKNEAKAQAVGSACKSCNFCGSCNSGTYYTLWGGGVACSAPVPANPPNYGKTCTSAPNACGEASSGTIDCYGACTAVTPANNICGSACVVCNPCRVCAVGTTVYGLWGVPSCSVAAPPTPPGYSSVCYSNPNACSQKYSGFINCSGTCTVPPNPVPPLYPLNALTYCQSYSNACGYYNTGVIQCNTGVCSAPAPPPRTYTSTTIYKAPYGNACFSAFNSCNQRNSGTITCTGECSATVPPNPAIYGTPCVSPANACGMTTPGVYNCVGVCSATVAPPVTSVPCTSEPNSCGDTNTGTISCGLPCSAVKPAERPLYGTACTSAPNNCGQTTTGTINCLGVCNAVTPSNATCAVNGACGPADGQSFFIAPTTDLCNVGTPSALTGRGPWYWTCSGELGGTESSCRANGILPNWREVGF